MNCAAPEAAAASGEQISAVQGTWCNISVAHSFARLFVRSSERAHVDSIPRISRRGPGTSQGHEPPSSSSSCLRARLTRHPREARPRSIGRIAIFIAVVIQLSLSSRRVQRAREPRGLSPSRSRSFVVACRWLAELNVSFIRISSFVLTTRIPQDRCPWRECSITTTRTW